MHGTDIGKERSKRGSERNHQCRIVRRVYAADIRGSALVLGVNVKLHGKSTVFSGERRSVMEGYIITNVESINQSVFADRLVRSDPRLDLFFIAIHRNVQQRIIDLVSDILFICGIPV